MSNPYYAADLVGMPLPEGFNTSLTISGLVNHGARRFPLEWEAVLADRMACFMLMEWVMSRRPDDGSRFDLCTTLATRISQGGFHKPGILRKAAV